ncbi:unnamed protein product [Orchesella dallaii]|uniref:G-protein coupled receptors family 2 profile 2 domain-containing protein n=1 Tax=Orchesella dallaii TaxID=48710 RepID=A0ABP1S7V6_9HEXA
MWAQSKLPLLLFHAVFIIVKVAGQVSLENNKTTTFLYKCPDQAILLDNSLPTNWKNPKSLVLNLSMSISPESQFSFELIMNQLNCRTTSNFHTIRHFYWHPEQNHSQIIVNGIPETVTKSNLSLLPYGVLVWNKEDSERYVYGMDHFCISNLASDGWITFKVCHVNCSVVGVGGTSSTSLVNSRQQCVRKCCAPHQLLKHSWMHDFECVGGVLQSNHGIQERYSNSKGGESVDDIFGPPNNIVLFGKPTCSYPKRIYWGFSSESAIEPSVQILEDGALFYQTPHWHTPTEVSLYRDYCLDGDSKSLLFFHAVWCSDEKAKITTSILNWRNNLFFYTSNLISVIFLLATLVLLAKQPYKGNIQNWLRAVYVSALLSGRIPMTVYQMLTRVQELYFYAWKLCMLGAWATVSSFFVAYFTVSTLIFELWWRVSQSYMKMNKNWIRVVIYAIPSVGLPLVISGNVVKFTHLYKSDESWCFIDMRLFPIPALFYITGILLLINTVLVIWTKKSFGKVEESTGSQRMKQAAQLCFSTNWKLLVLMGLFYLSELAFELARSVTPFEKTELLLWIFAPFDFLNSFMGIVVFLIYFTSKLRWNVMNFSSSSNIEERTISMELIHMT